MGSEASRCKKSACLGTQEGSPWGREVPHGPHVCTRAIFERVGNIPRCDVLPMQLRCWDRGELLLGGGLGFSVWRPPQRQGGSAWSIRPRLAEVSGKFLQVRWGDSSCLYHSLPLPPGYEQLASCLLALFLSAGLWARVAPFLTLSFGRDMSRGVASPALSHSLSFFLQGIGVACLQPSGHWPAPPPVTLLLACLHSV